MNVVVMLWLCCAASICSINMTLISSFFLYHVFPLTNSRSIRNKVFKMLIIHWNFFPHTEENLLNEYYCKLKNIQLVFQWIFTFLWRKWIFDFVAENFPSELRSKLFLPFYSENISSTKILYPYKFIGLDEIYKMVSLVFQYVT